jgi:hypothetical protein
METPETQPDSPMDSPPPSQTDSQADSQAPAEPPETSLQGSTPPMDDDKQRAKAIDQAFDYRGDVTVETTDGKKIDGFVFDRTANSKPPVIRIMPTDGSGRLTIPYDQISAVIFSGKDTAFGKGWEAWSRKYKELKSKGQEANIESDPLK